MDDSDKKNSPEPDAQLKHFGWKGVLSMGLLDSIASLATRCQRRRAWSEANGSQVCHGSFVAICQP